MSTPWTNAKIPCHRQAGRGSSPTIMSGWPWQYQAVLGFSKGGDAPPPFDCSPSWGGILFQDSI